MPPGNDREQRRGCLQEMGSLLIFIIKLLTIYEMNIQILAQIDT